jgi:phenylpropionate dioxygenase-like ring-hydroxylating dioxygenase large terminal subunit
MERPSVDAKAERTACASPRGCAVSYPVKEQSGVLWVWPTPGADAWLEASAVPVATEAAEFGDLPGDWGMVELPVGYAPALENQFDPSHAEWLHAKYDEITGGLSETMNVKFEPMTLFNVKEGSMNKTGFIVQHGGYNAGNKDVSAERLFTAPCSSRSEYKDASGNRYLSAAILYTPTEPGRCLMFTKFQAHTRRAVQGAGGKKITTGDRVNALLSAPAQNAFRWYMEFMVKDPALVRVGLNHGVYGNAAYTLGDQDIQAMHGVEVAMESREKSWKQSYYLPSPSDAGVAGFRKWMDDHAGGGVRWAEGVRDDASKVKPIAQRLERYERHTRHCRHCKETLKELGILEERCVALSNAMLAGGLALGLGGAIVGQEGPAVVSLCIAGIMMNAAEQVRDMQNEFKTSVPRRGDPIPKLW